ncbi:MAG: hypothetical protein AAGJ34_05585 [Pseudomonadota bacterium]
MIRPEIITFLRRWTEAIAFGLGAVVTLAFVLVAKPVLIVAIIVLGFSVICAILAYLGYRRVRLRDIGQGPGHVELRERKIAYFGPSDGGILSLDNVTSVALSFNYGMDRTGRYYWVLHSLDAPPLSIPSNASGIDALIAGLSALPGIQLDRAAQVQTRGETGLHVIWQAASSNPLPPPQRLV